MSVDSVLDEALTILLAKAQRPLQEFPRSATKPAMVHFEWTGGGAPLTVAVDPVTSASVPTTCDPILVEVPFPCSIQWAHMFAGDAAGNPIAVSATVSISLTQLLTFGASVTLHGTGLPPTLTLDSATDASIEGWQTSLVTGDVLIARLTSFIGNATWLVLTLLLRPTGEDQGVAGIVDDTGAGLVDNNGNPIVMRN